VRLLTAAHMYIYTHTHMHYGIQYRRAAIESAVMKAHPYYFGFHDDIKSCVVLLPVSDAECGETLMRHLMAARVYIYIHTYTCIMTYYIRCYVL